ncbi:hypothetical protein HDV00_009219 [Rhizophlyctis rosea]|nr:hypothetical protein HDV00_009219 [Rhizophlyctis rosea]
MNSPTENQNQPAPPRRHTFPRLQSRTLAHRIATAVRLRVDTEGGRRGLTPVLGLSRQSESPSNGSPSSTKGRKWKTVVVDALREGVGRRGMTGGMEGGRVKAQAVERIAEAAEGGIVAPTVRRQVITLTPKPSIPKSTSRVLTESAQPTLTTLPSELLISIAAHAGFWASLTLSMTSRRLHHILSDRAAWREIIRHPSKEEDIVNEVTITTKIGVYDHLLFGVWDGEKEEGDGGAKGECLFFTHRTFNDEYDFLGGVSFKLLEGGLVEPSFFEHRELLPCYRSSLQSQVLAGAHPPTIHIGPTLPTPNTLPTPDPIGTSIDHTCPSCTHYTSQQIQKSVFVYNTAETVDREGVDWTFEHGDGRRKVRVRVVPYRGVLGYGCDMELPLVTHNAVSVGGRVVKGRAREVFGLLGERR